MQLGLQALPALVLFKEGRPVDAIQGSEQLAGARQFLADYLPKEEDLLLVRFEDVRQVAYDASARQDLVLAYAVSVHKSQGSEYKAVVVPLHIQHYPLLRRNLVYTAVTRGKKLVVIVGEKRALAMAIKGRQSLRRWSKLWEWLELAGNQGTTSD